MFQRLTRKAEQQTITVTTIIFLTNLMHLISFQETRTLVREITKLLTAKSHATIYGPFMRNEKPTSQVDINFHQCLSSTTLNLG